MIFCSDKSFIIVCFAGRCYLMLTRVAPGFPQKSLVSVCVYEPFEDNGNSIIRRQIYLVESTALFRSRNTLHAMMLAVRA